MANFSSASSSVELPPIVGGGGRRPVDSRSRSVDNFMTVVISILGPVEAARDGNRVDLGAPQQRALLALLATSRGPISLDTIIDTLWPDDPPASAAKVVQTYVSRLRKALGEDTIERRGGGYALTTPPTSIDAVRFEQLAREGAFHEALALWRGPALADLGNMPGLAAEAARLDEERLGVLEQRIDADIAAGRPQRRWSASSAPSSASIRCASALWGS